MQKHEVKKKASSRIIEIQDLQKKQDIKQGLISESLETQEKMFRKIRAMLNIKEEQQNYLKEPKQDTFYKQTMMGYEYHQQFYDQKEKQLKAVLISSARMSNRSFQKKKQSFKIYENPLFNDKDIKIQTTKSIVNDNFRISIQDFKTLKSEQRLLTTGLITSNNKALQMTKQIQNNGFNTSKFSSKIRKSCQIKSAR